MAWVVTRAAVISFLRGQVFQALPQDPSVARFVAASGVAPGVPVNFGQADKIVNYLDYFDKDGRSETFVAADEKGALTPSGRATDLIGEALGTPGLSLTLGLPIHQRKPLAGRELSRWIAALGPRAVLMRQEENRRLVESTGVGRYFGIESRYNKMDVVKDAVVVGKRESTQAEKGYWLEYNKRSGTSPDWPLESSCIGFALEVMEDVYRNLSLVDPDQWPRWQAIAQRVAASKYLGTVLCSELQKTGQWEPIYWLTDQAAKSDGGMQATWADQLWKTQVHFGIAIPRARQMRNWRPEPDSGTSTPPEAQALLEKLLRAPFAVGIAKGGYHCFGLTQVRLEGQTTSEARCWEVHWRSEPNDPHLVDTTTRFLDEPWISGVMMIPTGLLDTPLSASEDLLPGF